MCNHILGRGTRLNNVEGYAYIETWIRQDGPDYFIPFFPILTFPHCPLCGEKNDFSKLEMLAEEHNKDDSKDDIDLYSLAEEELK